MSYKGPYSALATAAHEKREEGKRDEQIIQLSLVVADALEKAKVLYLGGVIKDPGTHQQMGKVYARLFDAGALLMEIREREAKA